MINLPNKIKYKNSLIYKNIMTLEGRSYVYRCKGTGRIIQEIEAWKYVIYKYKFEIIEG